MDFAVSQLNGAVAVVVVRTGPREQQGAAAPSVVARDARWNAEALTLDFSYALPICWHPTSSSATPCRPS